MHAADWLEHIISDAWQIQLLMTNAAKQSPLASKITQLRQLQTQMAIEQKYMNAGTVKGLVQTRGRASC